MAIELIDKIKQKNNGTFKLVDAVDVELKDGRDVETVLMEHMENHPTGGGGEVVSITEIHTGDEAPEEEQIVLWIDTDDTQEVTSNIEDSVIDEFRAMFKYLNDRVIELEARNAELEIKVEFLMQNGVNPPVSGSSDVLTFEDGTIMTFEDGSIMTFEGGSTNATLLTFEDNSIMVFEDNSKMTFE